MNVLALGTSEFILGFKLAGMEVELANKTNIKEKILQHKEAAVVIVDQSIVESPEELETSIEPVVLLLAPHGEEQLERLKRTVKNTLGVSVL